MKKYKLIALGTALLIQISSFTDAVIAWTLRGELGNPDVSHKRTEIKGNYGILNIIGAVNNYLRFAIGLVCFIFMIWNGFQLIMARGNEKDMDNAKNALIGCGIGLASCFLAYIIVNIAINLFK